VDQSASESNDALRSRSRATNGATLLPLSYTAPSNNNNHTPQPLHNARRSPRHQYDEMPTPTCHNFLLGGNYFPGKDKRRKHLRRKKKNFLARISPVRLGVLTVILLYLIQYWLFPTRFFRVHQHPKPLGWWWTPAASLLDLNDRSQVQLDAKRLQKEQDRLADTKKRERFAVLEQLSTEWFHRDDHALSDIKNNNRQTQPRGHRPDKKDNVERTDTHRKAKEETANKNADSHPQDKRNASGNDTNGKPKAVLEPDAKSINGASTRGKLKKKMSDAKHSDVSPISKSNGNIPRRTLETMTNFSNRTACPSELSASEIATTLVVQTSLNRSWVLEETCKRWMDPIVAVIALTQAESNTEESNLLNFANTCPNLHVVTYKMNPAEENPAMYPVNHLRNLGLDQVKSSHVLVADVDFVPSDGICDGIRQAIVLRNRLREKAPASTDAAHHEAIVVPAFQRNSEKPCLTDSDCSENLRLDSAFIPYGFENLRDCVKNRDCTVFQYEDNWEGHHSTRSERWLAKEWYEDDVIPGTDMKDLKRIRCFDSLRYEPYVVIRWCPPNEASPIVTAPFYDERFHGYGKNKIEYIQHLRFAGYRFAVLPEGFIVHNPHPPSKAKEIWNDRESHSLHRDMDALYPKFLAELLEHFKDAIDQAVGLCERH